AEDGIRDRNVTGVQTCALPIYYILNFYLFVAHAINATPLAIKIIENNCRPDICSRMKNMPAPVVTISEPPIMSGLPTATSRPRQIERASCRETYSMADHGRHR